MAEARFSDAPPNRRPVTLELDPDEALAILAVLGKGASFNGPINTARSRVYKTLEKLLGNVGCGYKVKNNYSSDFLNGFEICDSKGHPA